MKIRDCDLPWMNDNCIDDAIKLWKRLREDLRDDDFIDKYDLDERKIEILTALFMWIEHGQRVPEKLKDYKQVRKYLHTINKRRLDTFIGCGSEGVIFTLGDSNIIKLFFYHEHRDYNAYKYIQKWITCEESLKVIPHILKYDSRKYRWIVMEKFTVPVPEGKLLKDAINVLWYADMRECNRTNIDIFNREFTESEREWTSQWLKQYCKEYRSILGERTPINDDIRIQNIGKDKKGNIVIFDWYDIFR